MEDTHLDFLLKKVQGVSAQYTEAITAHQQRLSLQQETLHNYQAHHIVVNPSTPEELLNAGVLAAATNRYAQSPTLTDPR